MEEKPSGHQANTPGSDQRREVLFSRTVAAQMARISLDFLDLLEKERMVQPRKIPPGEEGYSAEDIARLACIRRLHEHLGLDLEAVEVVLQMRSRILELLHRVEEMERRLAQRERELLAEVQELRRRLGVAAEAK